MENREIPSTTPLPGIIKVLGDGCNLAASRAYLLIMPVILDLFLLFGPKLRISDYFRPMFGAAFKQMLSTMNSSGVRQMEAAFAVLDNALSSVNLFGFLQTFPIGVSSILGAAGTESPLGKSAEIQLTSLLQIIPLIILFVIIGVLFGSLYYALTAAAAANRKLTGKTFFNQILNVLLLYIALIALAVILAIPYTCFMSIALMTFPIIYQIAMVLMIVVFCWLMIPLFYIPHGIFLKGLDLPHAVKESFMMASWSSPITIRFILLSLILTFGLDMIWSIPKQSSWLILFSIFGHAFVSTAILASSFILYKELDHWKNENRSFLEWRKENLRIKKILKKEPEIHD